MNKGIFRYIQDRLLGYFQVHGRDFPWRHTSDPYAIMIAEFMLQRTRAYQVVPVYKKFMETYPTIDALYHASFSELSQLLHSLGLHWRTSHFVKSAEYIVNKLGGKFPKTREELSKVPGIGEYIAGAIMVISYKKKEHVVDSNIARFLNRFFNLRLCGEIRRNSAIRKLAKNLFTYESPEKILFSVLDLTSTICIPTNPKCETCFLKDMCGYYNSNQPDDKNCSATLRSRRSRPVSVKEPIVK